MRVTLKQFVQLSTEIPFNIFQHIHFDVCEQPDLTEVELSLLTLLLKNNGNIHKDELFQSLLPTISNNYKTIENNLIEKKLIIATESTLTFIEILEGSFPTTTFVENIKTTLSSLEKIHVGLDEICKKIFRILNIYNKNNPLLHFINLLNEINPIVASNLREDIHDIKYKIKLKKKSSSNVRASEEGRDYAFTAVLPELLQDISEVLDNVIKLFFFIRNNWLSFSITENKFNFPLTKIQTSLMSTYDLIQDICISNLSDLTDLCKENNVCLPSERKKNLSTCPTPYDKHQLRKNALHALLKTIKSSMEDERIAVKEFLSVVKFELLVESNKTAAAYLKSRGLFSDVLAKTKRTLDQKTTSEITSPEP